MSTVQVASGVMVWEIFSRHTLGPLLPINYGLDAIAYLSVVVDNVRPFMATVYPCSNGYFHHNTRHRAKVVRIHDHENEFSVLQWPP